MIAAHLRPGILDDAAHETYNYGQCAALACAMVERGIGTPVFEVNLARCIDFAETDAYGLIEAGADHVLVRDADGTLWDINGPHNEIDYIAARNTLNSRCVLVDYDSTEYIAMVRSDAICALDIEVQQVELASTFVDAVYLLN